MSAERPEQRGAPDRDRLMSHAYDGIEEYDNPLPGWWKGIFVASIVFSLGYAIYYHLGGPGKSMHELYQQELADHFAAQAKAGGGVKVSDEMLVALSKDQATMASAKQLYLAKCAQCHGAAGEGKIGPNLTDDHWKHGKGKPTGIYAVIRDGVPAKGMLAWGKLLKPAELTNVAAYVTGLRGTKPPNPKAPEGERFAP